jgi:LacI family transcriptional regulator
MSRHRQESRPEPHVAVCVDKARAYGRGLLHGVADYVELYGPWSIFVDPYSNGQLDPQWLRRWRGDGILADIGNERVAQRLLRSGIPSVDVYGRIQVESLPRVGSDELAVGRLAAEHLAEREFKRFAFCGYAGRWWSDRRFEGFATTLAEAGHPCESLEVAIEKRTPRAWESGQQALSNWIAALPKPIGVMGATDPIARQVLDACRRARVAVPEEVAVVGVDNDEDFCRLCDPPLSSVVVNPRRIGYEGARILHRLMNGELRADQAEPVLVPPLRVAMRLSTEITAIEDKQVAEAVSYIRKHACDRIQAKDVAKAIDRSRSTLYRLFQDTLGRSPNDEILRVQLERAKALLAQTSHTLEEIAAMTGFSRASYFSVAFKREVGMTAGDYRASYRAKR